MSRHKGQRVKFTLRMPNSLYIRLKEARSNKQNMNDYLISALTKACEEKESTK